MILARTEQGKIELNGEPIAEWYKKRGIRPCQMLYISVTDTGPCMCLLGAMVFATIEQQMDIQEAAEWWETRRSSPTLFAAERLKETVQDLSNLELGFLARRWNSSCECYSNVTMARLGYDARMALLRFGGKFYQD